MPTDNARQVRVTINADGEVKDAEDPGLSDPWHRPWIDAQFPKSGRVYGWDISSYLSRRRSGGR